MARPKTDLEQRLRHAADDLFYTHGYPNTGVSDIVAAARTNKAGLYSYFAGKDELARDFVKGRSDHMTANISRIAETAPDLVTFFRKWMSFHKNETAPGKSLANGCGVANFIMQTDSADEEMRDYVRDLAKHWLVRMTAFIRNGMKQGRFPATPRAVSIARKMYVCHEGAVTMWKLTGSLEYFDEAVDLFEQWYHGATDAPQQKR